MRSMVRSRGMLAVLVLALLVRCVALDRSPPGFTFDEASIGYDAYALLMTGRDHHGDPWPVYLESFGDFKDPLNVYATIPVLGVLGLSISSVRAVSALFGCAGVLATYLLTRRLVGVREARVAGLLVAISPWHIHFSRMALEPVLLVFWTTLSLHFLHGKGREMVLAGATLALGMYSYTVGKVFLPLLAVAVLVARRHELGGQRRALACGFAVMLVILAPLISLHLYRADQANARITMLSILADPVVRLDMARYGTDSRAMAVTARFLHNWQRHFSPAFLFISGDPDPLNGLPGHGLLHAVLAPFIVLGLWIAVRQKRWVLIAWLVLFPVAGALTDIDVAQARRAITLLPLPHILAALAITELRRMRHGGALVLLGAAALALSFAGFMADHLVAYPRMPAPVLASDAPLIEALAYLRTSPLEGPVVIDPAIENAYIQVLFHERVPPERLQVDGWEGLRFSFIAPPFPKGTLFITPGGPYEVGIQEMEVLGRSCGSLPDGPSFAATTGPGTLTVSTPVDMADICREIGFEVDRGTTGILDVHILSVEGGVCPQHCPGQMYPLIRFTVPPGSWRVRAFYEKSLLGEAEVVVEPTLPEGTVVRSFLLPDGSPALWLVRW